MSLGEADAWSFHRCVGLLAYFIHRRATIPAVADPDNQLLLSYYVSHFTCTAAYLILCSAHDPPIDSVVS